MAKFKLTKGVHYHDRKRLKPGDEVECAPEKLRYFMDKFTVIEEDPVIEDIPEPVPLEMKHRGGGRWDVINRATGKAINDIGLTKEEALALLDGGNEREDA